MEGQGRKRREGGGEGERVGREGGRGGDVEGPGKWSAPGPALALGGPACMDANMHFTINSFRQLFPDIS